MNMKTTSTDMLFSSPPTEKLKYRNGRKILLFVGKKVLIRAFGSV